MDDIQQPATLPAFGQLLKRLRTAADLTQEKLAERSGVSARLISDIERGAIQRSRRDTVRMLADGLELAGDERHAFIEVARGRSGADVSVSLSSTLARQVSLPQPPTGIVGREREVTATTSLLHQPEVRLLTLTGAGGVGKTRLALEAAANVADTFSHGAVFVDLAPLTDTDLVIPTIARALGVRDQSETPTIDQLVASLQAMQVLVVLDNFEHLVPAALEIASLLERCPGLTLLVTSRQALRLRAEREYPISPLALPDLDHLPPQGELIRIPAIDLFVRRAEAARPSFALTAENEAVVARIAVRLDGLPLAIELAAARMKVLSPAELLARLENRLPLLTGGASDLPARQQTLRATIDWSHELLDAAERRLFRRLCVFSGGFTLRAAGYVNGNADHQDDPSGVVLDVLESLIDKSLVRALQPADTGLAQTPSRFGMLETIREYGLEQLCSAGEEAGARDSHAAWCVDLVERAAPELTGPNQRQWLSRLEIEQDNIRSALRWTIRQADSETALQLCGSLYRFWIVEAMLAEGRSWTEQTLEIAPATPGNARGHALLGLGMIEYFQGDYERAEADTEEALRTFEATAHKPGIAFAYGNLGLFADVREDYEQTAGWFERALSLFQEIGDSYHIGVMYGNLGLVSYFQGDYERANAQLNESLAIGRERGDMNGVALNLSNLALVALALGEYDRAESLQWEALDLRRAVVNQNHLARNFDHFAQIAAAKQEFERAARLFGAAEALRAEIGTPLQPNDQEQNERCIAGLRAGMGEAAFTAAWESGAAMSSDEAIDFALRSQQSSALQDVPGPHHDDD